MARQSPLFASILFLFSILPISIKAQTLSDPVSYMSFIAEQNREIMKNFLSYTSAVAHGKNARKVENRRKELMQSSKTAIKKVTSMPPYQSDKSLRDSAVVFLRMTYHILNDDYGKIVNLEEIAERSYDDMEAYLLAQDMANEKLEKAHKNLNEVEKNFANMHNIILVENQDKLSLKLEQASKVNNYHRQVYLIFFKSYKQEVYMLEAIEAKNINGIEQNKNALERFSEEGISQLIALQSFNGDKSLMHACRQSLEFYSSECKLKIPSITSFYLLEEEFSKINANMENKRKSELTQSDVDNYNKAVSKMNKSLNEFNNINAQLFNGRSKILDNWNKTSRNFMKKHTPHYN